MSILEKEYNLANFKETKILTFYSEAKVSLIDILSSRSVEVNCLDYVDCACKSSTNSYLYFKECDKCHGTGIINLNRHEVKCNKCKGLGKIRIKDCYLCDNKGKLLLNSKLTLNLNPKYLDNNEYIINHKDYNLVIKLDIFDKDDYYIENGNVYYLRTIYCSKLDHKNKKKFSINTIKDISYIESEFKKKKEIVCLKNKGIDDKDFYVTIENELENEKEEIYTNIIIDKTGYALMDDLIKEEYVFISNTCPLDSLNSVYIDKDTTKISNDDYVIYLNRLDSKDFIKENDKVYLKVNLNKDDILTDKKTVVINNENINLNYKKNLKNKEYIETYSKCVKDKLGKRNKLNVIVYPYFENIYKISILDNSKPIYIEDYKYFNYELVETFKKDKYLTNPIKIDKQQEIVIDDSLIKIRRVK